MNNGESGFMGKQYLVIGGKYYFANNEVVVVDIVENFHLVKIKDNSGILRYVDKCALSLKPDTNTVISLDLFVKKNNDYI
jgi:hypothetical protein